MNATEDEIAALLVLDGALLDERGFRLPEVWGRFCYPVEGMAHMNKLNLIMFYHLGGGLRDIIRNKGEKPMGTLIPLGIALEWLHSFLHQTDKVPFPKTRKAADDLEKYLTALHYEAGLSLSEGEGRSVVTAEVRETTGDLRATFEREFEHESREINVMSVADRCAYSTTILIERGEDLLPQSVRTSVSDYARNELHEAGKCIAFNVPTAAGFHLVRAVESVLRNYYDALSSRAARPVNPNGSNAPMGKYIDWVQKWADAKVILTLRQITSLHRNPITHPEAVLTSEDAVVLVGVVVSAITGMVNDAKSKGYASLS